MFERLFDWIIASLEAFLPFVVIMPFENGVLVRLGQFKRVLEPGFHWCYPFYIDRVIHEHIVPRTERLSGLSTTTADGKPIGFDAIVTYRISDARKAILDVEDLKDAIADSCAGQIGTTLALMTWESVWKGESIDQLTKTCRARGWKWGVEIQSVQLAGVSLVKNLRVSFGAHHQPL